MVSYQKGVFVLKKEKAGFGNIRAMRDIYKNFISSKEAFSMKKVLTLCLAAVLLMSVFSLTVFARDEEIPHAYVTIVDENGEIVVAMQEVSCASNGVTIDDILKRAHDEYYDGGSAAGYASAESTYGLSLMKLWGNESGSYGYYVNNASPMSLADEVKPGDHIYAFVYTDTVAWTDTYCFFSETHVSAEKGDIATLTLYMTGFDENWNPVTLPVAGAVITVDGEKTDLITDENGQVAITYDKAGELIVSAVHDEMNLTPPVLVANVEGGVSVIFIVFIVAVIAVLAVAVVFVLKKKR